MITPSKGVFLWPDFWVRIKPAILRKIKLYIATSLNGKIARTDGSVDWLETIPTPDDSDYGYNQFYQSVDTTIMGSKTYEQIIDWGIPFPYPDKKNYVLTRKQRADTKHVEFICSNHLETIHQIKQQEGTDIWLIGGGQVNTLLYNANLIDKLQLFIMPIILPDGIELFAQVPNLKYLELAHSKTYSSGAVELQYLMKNAE